MNVVSEVLRVGGNTRKVHLRELPSGSCELEIDPVVLTVSVVDIAKRLNFSYRENDGIVTIF